MESNLTGESVIYKNTEAVIRAVYLVLNKPLFLLETVSRDLVEVGIDEVTLARPRETKTTEEQTKGYVPRKGQRVQWDYRTWEMGEVTTFNGIVVDFDAIDPQGTIIVNVDVGTPGRENVVSVRADRIKTWIEPEELK